MFARDFAAVPGKLALTIDMTRVMLPFLTMAAVAAAEMGMLNSLHHYFVPALAPAMFNVATIACALVLVPLMPALGLPPIMAIAIAALVGRRRSGRHPVAGVAARRISLSAGARSCAIPG